MAADGPNGPDPYYNENGRVYVGYRKGVYLLPCDETEKDRLDFLHTLFITARGRNLLNAPFQQRQLDGPLGDRSRVLDLGCGTGIWLLDMARNYPQTEFVGVDLAGMGPPTLLDNVEVRWPVDYEAPWSLGEETWDIVHLQLSLGSVRNWPNMYSKILRHLRPGVGWFEQVEIDFTPRCDDDTFPEGLGPLRAWFQYIEIAMSGVQRSLAYNPRTGDMLRHAGFVDIQEQVIKLPLNTWPTDVRERTIGLWYNAMLSSDQNPNGCRGMEAMSLAPLTRINEWPVEHARRLCAEALTQICDTRIHAYNNLHILWARSPTPGEPR